MEEDEEVLAVAAAAAGGGGAEQVAILCVVVNGRVGVRVSVSVRSKSIWWGAACAAFISTRFFLRECVALGVGRLSSCKPYLSLSSSENAMEII